MVTEATIHKAVAAGISAIGLALLIGAALAQSGCGFEVHYYGKENIDDNHHRASHNLDYRRVVKLPSAAKED